MKKFHFPFICILFLQSTFALAELTDHQKSQIINWIAKNRTVYFNKIVQTNSKQAANEIGFRIFAEFGEQVRTERWKMPEVISFIDQYLQETLYSPGVFLREFTQKHLDKISFEKQDSRQISYSLVQQVIQILLKDFSSENEIAWFRVKDELAILISMDDKVSSAFFSHLNHPDPSRRIFAAIHLNRNLKSIPSVQSSEKCRILSVFLEAFSDDYFWSLVRDDLANYFLTNTQVRSIFMEDLKSKNPERRIEAVRVLGENTPKFIFSSGIRIALTHEGAETRVLLQSLADSLQNDQNSTVRKIIAEKLGNLFSDDYVQSIFKWPSDIVINGLVAASKDSSKEVREAAAFSLQKAKRKGYQ